MISQSTEPESVFCDAFLILTSEKYLEAFIFCTKADRSSYATANPLMLAWPAFSSKSPIQTRCGMTTASSSRTFTGPVRPFFKVSRTFSLSSSFFLSSVMVFTSPIVFSSWVIWARVALIWLFTWVRLSSTARYQRKLPTSVPRTSTANSTRSCWPNSFFFLARTGRRLMRIMASSLLVRAAQGETDGDRRRRGHVHHVVRIEAAVGDPLAPQGGQGPPPEPPPPAHDPGEGG